MKNKRTIQEVTQHCIDNGYNSNARTKICAFLVGAGLKGTQDVLKFKIGEKTFEDFVNWYNTEAEDLVLERGRFVLLDKYAEVPALIIEVFEDACLIVSDTGLFLLRRKRADYLLRRCRRHIPCVGGTYQFQFVLGLR